MTMVVSDNGLPLVQDTYLIALALGTNYIYTCVQIVLATDIRLLALDGKVPRLLFFVCRRLDDLVIQCCHRGPLRTNVAVRGANIESTAYLWFVLQPIDVLHTALA